MTAFPVRRATLSDLDAIVNLRTEAEDWLRKSGIRQWTADYDQYARGVLAASVKSGQAWVVEDQGRVVATVSLNGPDADFWDPEDDLDSALYLGKMIVARDHAGIRLGDAIMNWASMRAAVAGRKWIRLDTRRDNLQLQRYYLNRGFDHVRTVFPPRRRTESGALFQRPAGSLTETPSSLREPRTSGDAGRTVR